MPLDAMTTPAYLEREQELLAPYAFFSEDTAGREHPEQPHPYRGPFQRDRDRIVHSSAFRRLAHKTQVFTGQRGDYHRSRLTHTLEVASIARTIGRELRLNEDLIETLALMHDIGHPPFGHAGERVLDDCCREEGGFNHNAHALRIVTALETRYPNFPGLNLSAEVLSGQQRRIKHAQRVTRMPLLEVQVVDAADSIAYDTHDVDDSLELGLLRLSDLLDVPLWHEAAERVRQRFVDLETDDFRRAVIHQLIETLVSDLVEATRSRLEKLGIQSAGEVQAQPLPLAAPTASIAEQKRELEAFLFDRVYRHPNVLAEREVTEKAVRELFDYFGAHLEAVPEKFRRGFAAEGAQRVVCDYLASMTDRMALELYHSAICGER